ncbi:LAFE_0G05490g1_1 [Lachancea fermentati]|uniref:LAFE_0G05490g1_1 n=1 Tax=Lachancea fermentati TaxID=4955 RepID=A0A1G4MH97_LACFM|nr:LAFE_0G05490g1_1 [Lachancea fermentati]
MSVSQAVKKTCSEVEEDVTPRVNAFRDKHPLSDPGNHSRDHFKKRMGPLRFKMRDWLLPFTRNQSERLYKWQSRVRCDLLDKYFGYTSLMGSHTFYVIMLPLPRWFGYSGVSRDLVYILGYSIYLSGFFKDYWCLPRPQSPPLVRVALSGYTTKEYGAPSSHTANSTAVTLLLMWYIYESVSMSWMAKLLAVIGVLIYYFTLTVGRIYCGMHGLLDIISGAIIGAVCFLFRWYVHTHTNIDPNSMDVWGWWFPICSVVFGIFLLYVHAKPVDQCPCFEDSVAFVGVISGLECSDWVRSHLLGPESYTVPYSWVEFGLSRTLIRCAAGVAMVLLWKSVIGKPLIYASLNCVLPDDRPKYAHVHDEKFWTLEVPLYLGRSNTDLLGRYILYAGVPTTVALICPMVFTRFGL